MHDKYHREINYLRISVTDRCNLRCIYCMPEEGIRLLKHEDILNFGEITNVVREAVKLGVDKVRLTGGEPLVRRGIVDLVKMIGEVEGVKDLSMTTNGILLDRFASPLKQAGLQRVNVSLDTLNPAKYKKITRVGDLHKVMDGLQAAVDAGLSPIKINCVVDRSSDEPDALQVKKFSEENGFQVRFIHKMDLSTGQYSVVEGGEGGNCKLCNRLRLTANGLVKPCLFDAIGFSVRELGAKQAILKAVENKPRCGTANLKEQFYNIGG
jgi:cyclic pyranopterin phosphate synthase